MADRYWVGGTASWDGTAGSKWALTSGGAGGQAVPTSADDVFFDAASGAVTCTVGSSVTCRNLNFTGFTGTFSNSSGFNVAANGNVTFVAAMTLTPTAGWTIQFLGSSSSTLTSAGKTIANVLFAKTSPASVTLQDALTTGALEVNSGTFTTNNFNVTATSLSSNNSNTRTINLGSSTVTLSASGASVIGFAASTNLTFNAGTSQINLTNASTPQISVGTTAGSGVTFYNVAFTTTATSYTLNGQPCVFNNLSFAGRTSAGITTVSTEANQTINGTLTLSAGTNATMRTFLRSNTLGTTRTLTCAAVASLTDIDFRDITIAGAAAPVSGTRLGDCKGNGGITFPAAKTVYWQQASSSNWGASGSGSWANTLPGTPDQIYFPLAQDIAVIPSTAPTSGSTVTVNAAYNIGTIDMSARTSNTMTLATGSTAPFIYGNWINGTGTTISGTATITFAGRGSQTITSAGKTFTQSFTFNTPSGSVTLQDALSLDKADTVVFLLSAGGFNANGYNVTLSATTNGRMSSDGTAARSLATGTGTWTLAASGTPWSATSSLTVTGTGTISLTSASAKTFAGGGIQTYPTLNQGGTGTLTVTGSNKFAGLTNTAIGRIQFTGGTTNEFTAFNINGVSGNLLQVGSTNTTQAILQKPTAWLMGANSTDAGNNTGLSFTAGGGIDYLSVSYINGTVVAPPAANTGNFFVFF